MKAFRGINETAAFNRKGSIMYKKLIQAMKNEPKIYESTGIKFWDDEYISKSMLKAHLDPDNDGASRTHESIKASVNWITSFSESGKKLLDLGCGPGIYAELFSEKGFYVTGMDFSKRSIAYAREAAKQSGKNIEYLYQDYLTMDYENEFDLVTLIYCDFGVLPPEDRKLLLEKIYKALKPGGIFVADMFTTVQYKDFSDSLETTYEDGGFWSQEPYVCIKKNKEYEEHYYLEQYAVIAEEQCQIYNLWNHAFSKPEIEKDLHKAGFGGIEIYGDVSGNELTKDSTTMCITAFK